MTRRHLLIAVPMIAAVAALLIIGVSWPGVPRSARPAIKGPAAVAGNTQALLNAYRLTESPQTRGAAFGNLAAALSRNVAAGSPYLRAEIVAALGRPDLQGMDEARHSVFFYTEPGSGRKCFCIVVFKGDTVTDIGFNDAAALVPSVWEPVPSEDTESDDEKRNQAEAK